VRLATTDEVLSRMSINSTMTGNIASATSALNSATPIVEGALGTSILSSLREDYFQYQVPRYREKFVPVTLNLSQGFVYTKAGSLTVYESLNGNAITDVADTTQAKVVVATDYIVDHVMGTVTLLRDVTVGYHTIVVKYKAGYGLKEGLFEDIPEWLTEAGIASAIKSMLSQSVPNNKKDSRDTSRDVNAHFLLVINPHVRPVMSGAFPNTTKILKTDI